MEESIVNLIFNEYQMFLLVLVRTSGLFILSPLFSGQNVPNTMKVGLTFFISMILTPTLTLGVDLSKEIMFILIFKEFLIGVIIGFIAYAFFSAFFVMGQMIDMRIGFSMANVIDPQSKTQVPLTGNFYYMIAFLLILLIDGHHIIIKALRDSYAAIPIGTFIYSEDVLKIIVNSAIKSFEIGFKLSTPIVAVIFLVDVILGIMARTIPQMNVFVVGMPLKLIIGLFIMAVALPLFFGGVQGIFESIVGNVYDLFNI